MGGIDGKKARNATLTTHNTLLNAYYHIHIHIYTYTERDRERERALMLINLVSLVS